MGGGAVMESQTDQLTEALDSVVCFYLPVSSLNSPYNLNAVSTNS